MLNPTIIYHTLSQYTSRFVITTVVANGRDLPANSCPINCN